MLAIVLVILASISSLIDAQGIACSSAGGNGYCLCQQGTFVNCGFLGLVTRPAIPFSTQTLLLNDNAIIGFLSGSFLTFSNIQVLHLERNGLYILQTGVFDPLTMLSELYLQSNVISNLQTGLFNKNSALIILNLSQNVITAIPTGMFSNLVNLQKLYLSKNTITSLPSLIFANLTKLNILDLTNNLISVLPAGTFNRTLAITQLSMQLNQIKIIPQGSFTVMPHLVTLLLQGNPSVCSINATTNKPQCNCYLGYVGDSTFCQPINCGPTILNADINAFSNCTNNTSYLGNNCTLSCNSGYYSANSSYYCNTAGLWTGSLTCNPVDCTSSIPLPPNAYGTCTGNTHYGGNNCTLGCNVGYIPVGNPNYYCGKNAQWIGSFSCRPLDCGPVVMGLDVHSSNQSCSPTTYGSTCTQTCIFGYLGGPATFTCSADGLWHGTLTCFGVQCGRTIPSLPGNTTSRCRGNTVYQGVNCTANCINGFVPAVGSPSSANYYCSASAVWTLGSVPLSCTPINCGPLIGSLIDVHAISSCSSTSYLGSPCSVTCNQGYVGQQNYVCLSSGAWLGNLVCQPINCGHVIPSLPQGAAANCTGDTRYLGTPCTAYCTTNWTGTPLNYTCNQLGQWVTPNFQISCLRKDCGRLLTTPYAAKNCTGNTRYGGNNCSISCPEGMIGSSYNYTCAINGTWIGNLTCTAPPPAAADSATVTSIGAGAGVAVVLIIIAIVVVMLMIIRRRKARPYAADQRSNSTGSRSSAAKPPNGKGYEDSSMILNPLHNNFRRRTNTESLRDQFESGTDFEEDSMMMDNPMLRRPLPPPPMQ